MIDFDEAVALTCAAARPLGSEEVALALAHRRILAEPVRARIASPRARVSSMDGYAVRDADLAGLPARLRVSGTSYPGQAPPPPLAEGECVRIFTGAPLPENADRVVIQEIVAREGDGALFAIDPASARFIREAGSDFRAGEILLEAGTLLGPRQLVAAAAADVGQIEVVRQPRVALIGTGDELAEPGTAHLASGAIPESISWGVAALAEEWGARLASSRSLPDRLPDLQEAAAQALAEAEADLVVVTGGASVGEKDHAKAMFAPHGLELVFSKVRMKPGKPVWLGRAGQALVLGLPGNPTSALVTARLFLAPLLCTLTGRDPAAALAWRRARLADAVGPVGDRETFARGTEMAGEVRLASNQDSGAQHMLARSDLLVRFPTGAPGLSAGSEVDVLAF